MAEDRALEDVFEDLEQQAAGLHLSERDAELADRAHGEYAQVTLESRVHASVGRPVRLTAGDLAVEGMLAQAGAGWARVEDAVGRAWVVRLPVVECATGLSGRALPEVTRPATARLTFRSALRSLCEHGDPVTVHASSGAQQVLVVLRIGADFLEGLPPGAPSGEERVVCAFAGVAAVRGG